MKRHTAWYLQDDWLMEMHKGSIHFIYVREASLWEKVLHGISIVVYIDNPKAKAVVELEPIPYGTWEAFQNDWSFNRPVLQRKA